LRKLIGRYVGPLPEIPQPIPAIEIPDIKMETMTSVWSILPKPVHSVQPKPFEAYQQDYGFILYKTQLIGHKSGRLTITELHDYATVFLNGKYMGKLDRREGEQTLDIPKNDVEKPVLEILVEGMGRINFSQFIIDRKGITDRVTLNGMTLMNWEVYSLPMDTPTLSRLKPTPVDLDRRGIFFRGRFQLKETADTYFDMTNYKKGLLWVNGHNLGRYWEMKTME
jgi:beta-galactosidase